MYEYSTNLIILIVNINNVSSSQSRSSLHLVSQASPQTISPSLTRSTCLDGSRSHSSSRLVRVPSYLHSNLYSLGAGKDGQLGHGDTKDQKQPKIV